MIGFLATKMLVDQLIILYTHINYLFDKLTILSNFRTHSLEMVSLLTKLDAALYKLSQNMSWAGAHRKLMRPYSNGHR